MVECAFSCALPPSVVLDACIVPVCLPSPKYPSPCPIAHSNYYILDSREQCFIPHRRNTRCVVECNNYPHSNALFVDGPVPHTAHLKPCTGGADRFEYFRRVIDVPNPKKTSLVLDWAGLANGEAWVALVTFLYLVSPVCMHDEQPAEMYCMICCMILLCCMVVSARWLCAAMILLQDFLDATGTLFTMARLINENVPGVHLLLQPQTCLNRQAATYAAELLSHRLTACRAQGITTLTDASHNAYTP